MLAELVGARHWCFCYLRVSLGGKRFVLIYWFRGIRFGIFFDQSNQKNKHVSLLKILYASK
jgi:hypothetical protein